MTDKEITHVLLFTDQLYVSCPKTASLIQELCEMVKQGPKTLEAKWLDPECWSGCQSLVLKDKLKRTERALEAANKILAEHGLIGVLVDTVNPL